jgi:hypothetical protein
MRSFHTSGSSTLLVNDTLKNYIKYHIKNIQLRDSECSLIFDETIPSEIIEIMMEIPGYINTYGNISEFQYVYNVENEDIGKVIKVVKSCLLTEKTKSITPIDETYEQLISAILSIGDIFSSFIEIVLCNLYTNSKDKVVRYQLRDNDHVSMYKKYSVYHVHSILSPTLNLLYKPNIKTITDYYNSSIEESNKPSIFEKIWLDL